MKRFFAVAVILAIGLSGCSGTKKEFKIGIDPNWYPNDLYGQTSQVNGFIEELLLTISRDSGLEFIRINANWDSLLSGLKQHKYEAAFTSLPPYNYNQAQYDFSKNVLDIGPVLVVTNPSKDKGLQDLANRVVGTLPGDPAIIVLQNYPQVLMRTFESAPLEIEALLNNEVEGIILERLLAVGYLRGSYAQKMKILAAPLSGEGLHLISLKGENKSEVKLFNKSLDKLIKKKKLQKLRKKWQLDV